MNIRGLLIALSLTTMVCSGCAPALVDMPGLATTPIVDVSGILHLQGKYAGGSACPISPTLALTSGHVVQVAGRDGFQGYTYSADNGDEGFLQPPDNALFAFSDIAILLPFPNGKRFSKFYGLAAERPSVGDEVIIFGYDWRDKKRAYATRVWTTKIIRIQARTLVLEDHATPGSSGSCVITTKDGKVVGINRGYTELDNRELVEVAVGVWGEVKEIIESYNAPTSN